MKLRLSALLTLGTSLIVANASAQTFNAIGDLNTSGHTPDWSFFSKALGISPDGSTVVGQSEDFGGAELGVRSIRWTEANGLEAFGPLNFASSAGPIAKVGAFDASSNGSIIVGADGLPVFGDPNPVTTAYQFTGGSLNTINDTGSTTDAPAARAISFDGRYVVGFGSADSGESNFVFDNNTNSGFSLSGFRTGAFGISGDGSTVVGRAATGPFSNPGSPVIWDDFGSSPTFLSSNAGQANDASFDGSVVIGQDNGDAFSWTSGGGIALLGDLAGGSDQSSALAIDADGSTIVGWGTTANGREAVIWNGGTGPQLLSDLITNTYGIDLTGWTLEEATGISATGLDIVGWGTNPDGNTEGFVFRIPEPATALMLALPMAALARRRR